MSTYTPIASQTLSTSAPSVTFSSIPQGYTDLVLVVSGSGSAANDVRLQFNNDTSSSYSYTTLSGTGSAAVSARTSNETSVPLTYYGGVSTTLGATVQTGYIMNYSNSVTNKTLLTRSNNANVGVDANAGLWRNTSAINTIKVFPPTANFALGTIISLYGIQVGQAAQKAQGGNIVTTDGTYVYHTFTSSGAFIPSQALTVDYLVVAGGGGGGATPGGGGGGGGYRTSIGGSALSVTAKPYPVIVGAGGAGGLSGGYFNPGSSGANSVFATITSTGGGYGGGYNGAGGAGGSGGGGGASNPSGGTGGAGNAGSYSPSEGNAGGSGFNYSAPTDGTGGGGGGASAPGTNAGASQSGNGGNGTANLISGTSITYAGGGGGGCYNDVAQGSGGTGGGGAGGVQSATGTNGTAGTVNLGGGGGGGSQGTDNSLGGGGNGGSGIVIIRYAA